MSAQLDIHAPTNNMDTSPTETQSVSVPVGLSPSFAPVVPPPHLDISLLPNSSSHLMHHTIFPNKADHPNAMATPMHVPLPDLSTSVDLVSMDVLADSPVRAPPPPFITDFPQQCDAFGMESRLSSQMNMESPPSLPTSASPESIHNMSTSYSVGISSLASALDTAGVSVSRSRAGSSASPGNLLNSISALGFSSPPGTALLPNSDSSSLSFPPSDYIDGPNGMNECPPEPPIDSHVVALNDMLTTIAKTATSARDACSMGKNIQAAVKIDELQRAISVVQAMFVPLSLADTSPPLTYSTLTPATGSIYSPTAGRRISPERISLSGNSPSADASAMDVHDNLDVTDLSRKRCASATPGDRVNKALKREPNEIPLTLISSTSNPLNPSFSPNGSSSSGVLDPSVSAPTSRPPSPGSVVVANSGFGNTIQHQPPVSHVTLNMAPTPTSPISEFSSNSHNPTQSSPSYPLNRRNRSSWSDPSVFQRQHQHSLSGSALNTSIGLPLSPNAASSTLTYNTPVVFPPHPTPTLIQQRPATNGGTTISPPLGRISRSGSVTGHPFAFGVPEYTSMESYDFSSRPPTAKTSPESDDEEEHDDHDASRSGQMSSHSSENGGAASSSHGNEVPLEYRDEVDRIFFLFLNKICSNLDATDSKGEPIHQTLMAKKMQRLDESPDFRPFKFRIAAFTNAFLEELARQGYPEEKIPMKKIRNYLWKQSHIQRFNEDGKKAKSKGNHIWNIDAKKCNGKWEFRPFYRKLAGSPPGVAYVGLRWSWTPRIWDPQASSTNLPVHYSSPSLPAWLSWNDDVLSGTPPPDAESCEITAEAKFMQDGVENRLLLTFQLHIAPMSSIDTTFASARRPSLVGETHAPRRATSDSVVPQTTVRSAAQSQSNLAQQPKHQSAQVMQVLESAAQRVAQEAQSQVIISLTPSEPPAQAIANQELQALVKQQHVLQAAASDMKVGRQEGLSQPGNSVLAVAAQQVVLQAARSVRADRTGAGTTATPSTTSQVTVNEVSVATQSAVAQAVEITGPLSSEVDVLMTATSILQSHGRSPASSQGALQSKTYPAPGAGTAYPPSLLPP